MPPFPRPKPDYRYDLDREKQALDTGFLARGVPTSTSGKLLLCSWNLANLGVQKRKEKDIELMAHLLKRFDLVAAQEVNDNFVPFETLVGHMGNGFDFLMSDTAGNNERLAFIYRKGKVAPRRMFGELAMPRKDFKRLDVVVPYKVRRERRVEVYYQLEFTPFDRNPHIGTFTSGNLDFTIVNVHLYFGAFKNASKVQDRAKYARRVMEIYTLAQWAKKRAKDDQTYDDDFILLGDMNVPEMDPDDAAYRALLSSGFQPTDYGSQAGSNLEGSKTYDQLAVTPGDVADRQTGSGIFDFDNFIFKGKWDSLVAQLGEKRAASKFRGYVKSYVSDHRPLWMEFQTT